MRGDVDDELVSAIRDRLQAVLTNVDAALAVSGRRGHSVTLVGVTKAMPVPTLRAAWAAGVTHFGENKVQEAVAKLPALSELPITWHFIGQLQRNKVRNVVGAFTMVHSLDRLSLAEELDRRARKVGRPVDCLVQVNIAGEASKGGLPATDVIAFLREVDQFEHIRIRGLMTIPPYSDNAEDSRRHFAALRELAERIKREQVGRVQMEHLSMGMSGDYPVAIEEGATIIRVGQALLGPRPV